MSRCSSQARRRRRGALAATALATVLALASRALAQPAPDAGAPEPEPDAGAPADADAGSPGVGAVDGGTEPAPQPPSRPVGRRPVVSPRPKTPIDVPYPEGAEGDQTVVLELTVDAGGAVRGMRVIEGTPPFSTAAMAAASGAAFHPAERDGEPVAARFLFRVELKRPVPRARMPTGRARRPRATAVEPPAEKPPAEKPPAPVTPARPALVPEVVPLEVVVEGERTEGVRPIAETGETGFTQRDVSQIPGAFGDAFRAVEVVPGVVPMVTGLPYFFVRGATPASAGYFLDGIRVPFLFHFAAGPSVVSPAIVEQVDFYPGAYPARHGRFIGGIVAATTTPPAREARAEALIRAIDAGAFVEVPFADGKLNAFAGARYSYAGPILSLFSPETSLEYWDYQVGASYALSPRDRVSFFMFGSHDYLGEVENEVDKEIFGTQFHRIDLRFDHARRNGPRARVAATLGVDRTGFGDEGSISSDMVGVRGDAEVPLGALASLRAGTNLLIERYESVPSLAVVLAGALPAPEDEDDDDDELADEFPPRTSGTFSAYVDLPLRPEAFLEVTPGLRFDLFGEGSDARLGVDPRASVRLKLLPVLTSVTLAGLAHQRPTILVPVPGLELPGVNEGLQEALHLSQGLEASLPAELTLAITGFHHTYWDLTDVTATCGSEVSDCNIGDRSDGRAWGLEVQLARPFSERLGGFVSYTFSRSERTALGETFASDFDRTHVVHVVLGYEVLPGWHAGARFTGYTGRPHSVLAFDDPEKPEKATRIGRINGARLPGFYRLDARLEKRWKIGRTGWVSVVLEGLNVTLQEEVVDFDCQIAELTGSGGPGLECGRQTIGPISIPSIGVGGGF